MHFETGDYVKMGTKESSLWGRVIWTTGYRARVDFHTFTADVVADDIITARRKPGDKLARSIVAKTAWFHYRSRYRDIEVYELYQQQRAMLGE